MMIRRMTIATVGFLATCLFLLSDGGRAEGIVDSIVKAPIAPSGDVAGQPTDLVINLNFSDDPLAEFFNPDVPGASLDAGNSIKILLPDDFTINTDDFPVATVFSSETCTPGNVLCNTGIIVQGQPQRPIRPISASDGSAVYSLTLQTVEGKNAFVHTADIDVVPGLPAPGAGIKQLHLITPGVTNPSAGDYEIEVIAETGPGGSVERGSGLVTIRESTAPSINVVSVFNEGRPNTIYQTALAGELTPAPHDFLLWGADGQPLLGVEVEMQNPESALLKIGAEVVGTVAIEGPIGGGHRLFTESGSTEVNAPIFGVPAGHLRAMFQAGSELGDFGLTYSLNGGTSAQMFVTVIPEPSSLVLLAVGLFTGMTFLRRRR